MTSEANHSVTLVKFSYTINPYGANTHSTSNSSLTDQIGKSSSVSWIQNKLIHKGDLMC